MKLWNETNMLQKILKTEIIVFIKITNTEQSLLYLRNRKNGINQ